MKPTTQDRVDAPVADLPASSAMVKAEPRERQLPTVHADAEGNVSPSQLILAALDRGVTPEALEKLVALQERMEDRNAAKEFNRALAEFKKNCPTIYKDKKITVTRRDGGSYSFMTAPLDHIADAIDEPLAAVGLSYGWDRKFESNHMVSICTLRHVNGHCITSSFPVPTESNNPGMSTQQKYAGAATFADRKSLAAVLGLVAAEEDTEAAKAVDPTPVTEDQLTEISDLIETRITGRSEAQKSSFMKKFLDYMGAESTDAIRRSDYARAIAALQPTRGAR